MENKNYLIIGGSYGIGSGIVEILAAQNANVYIASRTKEAIPQLPNVHHQTIDILDDEIQLDLPETLHGVVYCPGSANFKPFRSAKPAHFREALEVNLIGAVKVLQLTRKVLSKTENASVLLFSTVAVGQGMPYHATVAAAKGAVEGLVKTLAAEWAPKIRVNCIAPSLTDTPLVGRLLATDEKREASGNRHPLKRVGTVKDMAETACFLLSEKSSWITGQVIGVDGGMSSLRV